MTKSFDFYLDKAKQYVLEFDGIIKTHTSKVEAFFDPSLKTKYDEQKPIIEDLQLKSQLLFSEFDNGKIFNEHIEALKKTNDTLAQESNELKVYKRTLELFIEHINEFKK